MVEGQLVIATCVVILFFKMFAISLYQGYFRISRKAYQTAEDARFAGVAPQPQELPQVQQAAKAWRNDLENIPMFIALVGVGVWVGSDVAALGGWAMAFTLARIAHTVCFLAGWQPWRTLAFGAGIVCLFGVSVSILLTVG